MMRKFNLILLLTLLAFVDAMPRAASGQIVGTLPFTLQNGTIADANQVMSDLNTIVAAVNANAANAGANTNITALNGLTTPLVYTSGGSSQYIGGTSGGSANAQTIASPIPSGFNLIAGKCVLFTAGFTNSGAMTLNVNSTGVTNVFRQGVSGPVALSGGEVGTGNLVNACFDGTQYQISNASPQSLVPACTVIDWTGANGGPSGYLLANNQAVSRTTFATLFACLAVQGVAATTTISNTSVVVPNSALFQVGWFVGGNNVTCNSTITAIPDGTHITISANAGASGATTLTIGPYQQGDCSTTFNLPQLVGRATAMRDITGTVLTAATCTNFASIGSQCGLQTGTLVTNNLPPYTPAGTISITSIAQATRQFSTVGGNDVNTLSMGNLGGTLVTPNATPFASGAATFTGTAQGGTSTPFSNLQPTALVDKYIKF